MCHIDVLKIPCGIVDIGLIHDEANELALKKGPHSEVQPLSENLEAIVGKDQAANPPTYEPTDTSPVDSIPRGRTALGSTRSTLSATLVLLANVQKL